jgi:hypothetical protein
VARRGAGVLARLKPAYSQGGIPAVHRSHLAAAEKSAVYRALWKLLDLVFPLSGFLSWTDRLNGLIGTHGLHGAAARVCDDLHLQWETKIPPGGEDVLRTAPLILYGNHPSQITPLFLAAALGRADLRFFCIELYLKFLPAAEPYALPLQRSLPRKWRDRLGSGWAHSVALSLLFRVDEPKKYEAAREHNGRMLRAAAEHVRQGGCVLIFPMGEATGWRDWFQGIGVLAKDLAQTASHQRVVLAPFFVENESNARLYSLFSTSPLGVRRRRRLNRAPVRIQFGRPVPLEEIIRDPTLSPSAVTDLLERQYREVFPRT